MEYGKQSNVFLETLMERNLEKENEMFTKDMKKLAQIGGGGGQIIVQKYGIFRSYI